MLYHLRQLINMGAIDVRGVWTMSGKSFCEAVFRGDVEAVRDFIKNDILGILDEMQANKPLYLAVENGGDVKVLVVDGEDIQIVDAIPPEKDRGNDNVVGEAGTKVSFTVGGGIKTIVCTQLSRGDGVGANEGSGAEQDVNVSWGAATKNSLNIAPSTVILGLGAMAFAAWAMPAAGKELIIGAFSSVLSGKAKGLLPFALSNGINTDLLLSSPERMLMTVCGAMISVSAVVVWAVENQPTDHAADLARREKFLAEFNRGL